MAFLDECIGCHEGGVCYCTGDGGDTQHQWDCHTRIRTLDDYGNDLGDMAGCAVGCKPCKDYPGDVLRAAASSRPRVSGGEHQRRFLLPDAQDARGVMHELRAHYPHLVQQRMRWLRAANHDNFSRECVDADDLPCVPWPWLANEYGHGTPLECEGGVSVGDMIAGYFGEGFFYQGMWPPGIQCRRFPDDALNPVYAISPAKNTIFLTSASQGDACGADWLVPGAGWVVDVGNCDGRYARVHEGSDPPQDPPEGPYARIMCSGACGTLFDRVDITANDTSFVARDDVDPHDVDLHNAILAKVRTPGTFEGTAFDRLDHEARLGGNSKLGRFSRTWDATNLEGYVGITDPRLPVVRSYPESRTRWHDLPASVELVIVKAWIVLDLALPHTKKIFPQNHTTYDHYYNFVEPHCVTRIHVWLGLRVTVDANEHGVAADYSEHPYTWPDITPDGNDLLIAQEPGVWRRPPGFVEWRGVLNNFSLPSLEEQDYPRQVGGEGWINDYAPTLKNACTALGTWIVPGASVHLDSNPDEPRQHWGGGVSFTFTTTDDYLACNP